MMLERMKYNNQRSFGLFFSTMTYGLKKQEMSRRRNKYAQPIANKMLFVNRIYYVYLHVATCKWHENNSSTTGLNRYRFCEDNTMIQ